MASSSTDRTVLNVAFAFYFSSRFESLNVTDIRDLSQHYPVVLSI